MKRYVLTRPYRPSNGTEGDYFEERFCGRCERDRKWRESEGKTEGCEIHVMMLAYDERNTACPEEWVEDVDDTSSYAPPKTARCTAFIEEGRGSKAEAAEKASKATRRLVRTSEYASP